MANKPFTVSRNQLKRVLRVAQSMGPAFNTAALAKRLGLPESRICQYMAVAEKLGFIKR